MIVINETIRLLETDIDWTAIRAQGAGGQNVNKVSSAVHLRFNYLNAQLPEYCKHRISRFSDNRINKNGDIVIKAQSFRTLEKNREDAIARLVELLQRAIHRDKKRVPSKPTKSSVKRRLESKNQRSRVKALRSKVRFD